MLNKKAQATSWSFQEIFELILKIIVVIILFGFLASIIILITGKKPIDNQYRDFERLVVEIKDIQPGESYAVPILATTEYSFMLQPSEVVLASGSCDNKGAYCACLLEKGKALTCVSLDLTVEQGKSISVKGTEGEFIIQGKDTPVVSGSDVKLYQKIELSYS